MGKTYNRAHLFSAISTRTFALSTLFAVISGFCQVSDDHAIILADEAYTEGEINKEEAEEEYKNATSELNKLKSDDPKYDETAKRVERAKVLVDIAEKR